MHLVSARCHLHPMLCYAMQCHLVKGEMHEKERKTVRFAPAPIGMRDGPVWLGNTFNSDAAQAATQAATQAADPGAAPLHFHEKRGSGGEKCAPGSSTPAQEAPP